MSEINAEQRQKAKTTAANAAVAANDTAVVLGAAGAVVVVGGVASGVGALAGVGVGAALAVCSFGAWLVGNRYQRLANDPPRSDFDQITISNARLLEEALPTQEPDATVARFAGQQWILADALGALVDCLERFDGAMEAGDTAAATAQANAAEQNAQAAIQAHRVVSSLELGGALNGAWNATLATVDWKSVSIEQAQQVFRRHTIPEGDLAPVVPGEALQAVLRSVGDLSSNFADDEVNFHPLLTADEMPPEPQALVEVNFVELLETLSDSLRNLVVVDNA